jgi:hypothetical protein
VLLRDEVDLPVGTKENTRSLDDYRLGLGASL